MKLKKIDIGKLLITGAAAFQSYQFGRALNVYDPGGWHFLGVNLGGLALGVIVNVVVALAATRLPGVKGRTRTWASWGAFTVLLVLSPALIAPGIYLLLEQVAIDPWVRIFLSIGLAAAPDLAIALGGFIAGRSLINLLSDSPSETSKSMSGGSGFARGRSAKKSKPLVLVACRYEGAGCKMSGSQNAMNAHAPHCKFRPTVDDSLLIKVPGERRDKENKP